MLMGVNLMSGNLKLLLLGLIVGGGAGFFGTKLIKKVPKAKQTQAIDGSYWSSKPEIKKIKKKHSKRKYKKKSKRSSAYHKKSRRSGVKAVKKSRKKVRKTKWRARKNTRAEINALPNGGHLAIPVSLNHTGGSKAHGSSTPWIAALSGSDPQIARDFAAKRDDEQANNHSIQNRSIKVIGVVVDAEQAKIDPSSNFIEGEFAKGDGLTEPVVFVR
jgi:hypothetical protein